MDARDRAALARLQSVGGVRRLRRAWFERDRNVAACQAVRVRSLNTKDLSMLPDHQAIAPSVLYFGTPVVLIVTRNHDGTTNITPMSSAWALGSCVVFGLNSTA